jgi:iron(III) transport system substrate-binding protein
VHPVFKVLLASTAIAASCAACAVASPEAKEVVVYVAVDQPFSEPVLDAFEAETGIVVKPAYDVEAAKTTGLINRLMAEKDRPQADVWWSTEFAQTVELADKGVLARYASPSASDIPKPYVDAGGMWTGFGGRARVILVNTEQLSPDAYPKGMDDFLLASTSPDKIGVAHPVFGTSSTHAAALYATLGPEKARAYFVGLRDRGVKVLDGNAVVRDQVADGQLAFGLTDTDDACGAIERGAPVALVFPDQDPQGQGTLIIPNTVALVAGGPHPDAGKALIDYLLRPSTTSDLIAAGWFQLSLRTMDASESCVDMSGVKGMDVTLTEVAAWIERAKTDLAAVFVR